MLLRRTAADPAQWFTPEQLEESRRYQKPLKRLRLVEAGLGGAVLLAFVAGDAAPRLLDGLGLDRGWVLQLAVVVAALTGVGFLVEHWFSAYGALVYDREWGLSTQTIGGWLSDQVKNLLVAWVFLTLILVPVYAVIRATDLWWLFAWLVFMGLQVVFAFLVPVVLLPIFNKFTPMEDGELRRRLLAVAERAGVEVEGIYVMDASRRTRRDNAFVAGLGKTRRVVLFDTMLEYPPETIEHVVAHEIGHYRLHHIAKSIPVIGALTLLAFVVLKLLSQWDGLLEWAGVGDIGEPAAVPLFVLGFGLVSKATALVQSWHIRYKEREADLEALELLRDPDAMVDLWRKMGPKNKADLDPGWWARLNHDHPELAERMAFARQWEELQTGS
jgi:STE24 endopeptidase